MKEPREFVIVEMSGIGASMRNYRVKHDNESMGSIEAGCRNGPIENYYKVVEYSAYEKIQKENEALKAKLAKAKEELGCIKKYCDSCGVDAFPELDISRSIAKTLAELGE